MLVVVPCYLESINTGRFLSGLNQVIEGAVTAVAQFIMISQALDVWCESFRPLCIYCFNSLRGECMQASSPCPAECLIEDTTDQRMAEAIAVRCLCKQMP